jgi:hypothetical protein
MPNRFSEFQTNFALESLLNIEHQVLTFDCLWSNYPDEEIIHAHPETQADIFDNHCAINVSDALFRCGVLLKAFDGDRCWRCPTPDESGRGRHAFRAQDLADYLKKQPFAECPEGETSIGAEYESSVAGRTGIIFFKDYWQRSGETGRTGDHIDLWNKNTLASIGWFATAVRRTFPQLSEDYLEMSDLRRSTEVIFWEIV